MTIDQTDRRILRVLQEDGRITNQDLGERVGLSPSPCLRRLRRLEELEQGLIRAPRPAQPSARPAALTETAS